MGLGLDLVSKVLHIKAQNFIKDLFVPDRLGAGNFLTIFYKHSVYKNLIYVQI